MRHYETMFIIKPTLVEEEITNKISFFKEAITKNGGVIQTCLDMGMRNLAYQIKKQSRGYYFVIYFMANPELIFELSRLYRINEDVLRFIVIKYSSKKEISAWQTLVNRADKKEKPKSLKKDDDRDRSDRRHNENANHVNQSQRYNDHRSNEQKNSDQRSSDTGSDTM